jgi:hypothetical protein
MFARLASSLTALVLVASAAQADFTVIDDFNDGNLVGWNLGLGAPPVGSIVSTGGRMRATTFQPFGALPCFAGLTASWNAAYPDPDSMANGIYRIQFRPQNGATGGAFFIRDDAASSVEGYGFVVDVVNQSISICVPDETECLYPALAETPFPISVGVDYQVEVRADGGDFSMKVWPIGASEPVAPQLSASDDTYVSGGIFVSSFLTPGVGGSINGSWENFLYSPLPAPIVGDLDGNDVVDAADLAILLGAWGQRCGGCSEDLDGSGTVEGADLALLLGAWTA